MAARKLQQTRRGRNRLDLRVRIEYRSRGGTLSTRNLVVYRLWIRRRGDLVFDAFDTGARAELTFDVRRVRRLLVAGATGAWTDPQRLREFFLRILEVQELTTDMVRLRRGGIRRPGYSGVLGGRLH